MPTLVGLAYSPWTQKARWALTHHGVPHDFESYVPTLGEPKLRVNGKHGDAVIRQVDVQQVSMSRDRRAERLAPRGAHAVAAQVEALQVLARCDCGRKRLARLLERIMRGAQADKRRVLVHRGRERLASQTAEAILVDVEPAQRAVGTEPVAERGGAGGAEAVARRAQGVQHGLLCTERFAQNPRGRSAASNLILAHVESLQRRVRGYGGCDGGDS